LMSRREARGATGARQLALGTLSHSASAPKAQSLAVTVWMVIRTSPSASRSRNAMHGSVPAQFGTGTPSFVVMIVISSWPGGTRELSRTNTRTSGSVSVGGGTTPLASTTIVAPMVSKPGPEGACVADSVIVMVPPVVPAGGVTAVFRGSAGDAGVETSPLETG